MGTIATRGFWYTDERHVCYDESGRRMCNVPCCVVQQCFCSDKCRRSLVFKCGCKPYSGVFCSEAMAIASNVSLLRNKTLFLTGTPGFIDARIEQGKAQEAWNLHFARLT